MIRIIRIFVYLFISFWIRIFELNWIHLMMFLKRQIIRRKSSRERLNNKTRYHWRGLFIRWLIKLNTFELLPNSYLSMTPTFTVYLFSKPEVMSFVCAPLAGFPLGFSDFALHHSVALLFPCRHWFECYLVSSHDRQLHKIWFRR